MRFHNAIRKEVLDYLAEKMPNIKNFYNGIPNILDIKNELPLVCVHLDACTGRTARFRRAAMGS